MVTPERAAALCAEGHRADEANFQGAFPTAVRVYQKLLEQFEPEEVGPGAYLQAKATLGLLLTYVRSGDLDRALELWRGRDPLTRSGLGLLEQGYATGLDECLYRLLSAYLTACSGQDRELASTQICDLMGRAGAFLVEHDVSLLGVVRNNEAWLLEHLWDGEIPRRLREGLQREPGESRSPVAFLHPDAWREGGLDERARLEFAAPPPVVSLAVETAGVGLHSRWWPWIYLLAPVAWMAWSSHGVTPGGVVAGLAMGMSLSLPGWLLDYTARRRRFVGLGLGAAFTAYQWLPPSAPLNWGSLLFSLWFFCCLGSGLEIAALKLVESARKAKGQILGEIEAALARREWQAALARLDIALQSDPKNWRLHANRALCQAGLERPGRVEQDLARAAELGGESRLEAIRGYWLWRQAYGGDRGALKKALELLTSGEIPVLRVRAACQALALGVEAAESELTRGLQAHPQESWLYLDRARLRRAAGREEEALADLTRVIELDQNREAVLMARIHLMQMPSDAPERAARPPDPEVFRSPDLAYSAWFPERPEASRGDDGYTRLYARRGEVHYLLEYSDDPGEAGLRLSEMVDPEGEYAALLAGDDSPEVMVEPTELADGYVLLGMRKYTRLRSSRGDEVLIRRMVVDEALASTLGHSPDRLYQLTVWGPHNQLDYGFQFLGSLAVLGLGRRPRHLFVPSGQLDQKTINTRQGTTVRFGVRGSASWLQSWGAHRALTLRENFYLLEVDAPETLRSSREKLYAPYHEFVAYQHWGDPDAQGVRAYTALTPGAATRVADALRGGPTRSLLVLASSFAPGSIRTLADGLAGEVYETLGFFYFLGGDDLCDDPERADEMAYACDKLQARQLSLVTANLDDVCKKRLLEGLRRCNRLRECRVFQRTEGQAFPPFPWPELDQLLQRNR